MNGIIKKSSGRVLAIGAHPDDVEFGAGGFLSKLASKGAEVTVAVTSIPNKREIRYQEALKGAEVMGADLRVIFPDGQRVEDIRQYEIVRAFDKLIEEVRPELVITNAYTDLHYDHSLVNRATLSALRRTECDLLTYLSSPTMNAQARCTGPFYADISDFIEQKLEAVKCHKSQIDENFDVDSIRDLARGAGRIIHKKYAEVYDVLRMTDG